MSETAKRDFEAELHDEQCAHGQALMDADELRAERDSLARQLEEAKAALERIATGDFGHWDPSNTRAWTAMNVARSALASLSDDSGERENG